MLPAGIVPLGMPCALPPALLCARSRALIRPDHPPCCAARPRRLESRLASEAPALSSLSLGEAAASMPRLCAPMLTVDDTEPASAVVALRSGLDGMAALSAQRASLEEALKVRAGTAWWGPRGTGW